MANSPLPIAEQFWRKVAIAEPDECWLWTGPLHSAGYGHFEVWKNNKRKRWFAHRKVLELQGVDLTGLVVMHLCDNPPCVNPNHLRPGTQLENMRDALAKGRMNMDGLAIGQAMTKTHCKRDHPLSGPNLYVNPNTGGRFCRACVQMHREAYIARKRAA
jgi:hypothetical protein